MTLKKLAKLCLAIISVAICSPAQPSSAANFAYLSATGGGSTCTAAAPCATFLDGFVPLVSAPTGGRILCLDPVANSQHVVLSATDQTFDIDCPSGSWASDSAAPVFDMTGSNLTLTFRNMAFNGVGGATSAIKVSGSGTLIFENCVFANSSSNALDIEPNAAFNLVIKNSRISNSGAGILLKPSTGGSINATFDHVTITNNNGGGVRADSSNGPINVDISDSVISGNVSNGMNISSGSGVQNDMVSITRSTIAKNGSVGIQAGGSNGAVLLDVTLLDSNASGATLVVGSGRILSYGNNRIVGSSGSGFTGSAALQ